jgi:SNF2 family DNA or RNA helicase
MIIYKGYKNFSCYFEVLGDETEFINFYEPIRLGKSNIFFLPSTPTCIKALITREENYDSLEELKDLYTRITSKIQKNTIVLEKENLNEHEYLRFHQVKAVDIILDNSSFALFWEPRVGKTPPSCYILKNYCKAVILTRNGHQTMWQKAVERYANKKSIIVQGNKKVREDIYNNFYNSEEQILIINHDILANDFLNLEDSEVIKKVGLYDIIIVDEAHYLRNYKSLKSKATMKLRNISENALILTGTPASNRPSDIMPLLKFLHPKNINSFSLSKRYFSSKNFGYGEVFLSVKRKFKKDFQEFVQFFSSQLTFNQVMKWSPNIENIMYFVDLNKEQNSLYKKIISEKYVVDKNGEVLEENALSKIIRLQQVALYPENLGYEGISSSKVDWILEYISNTSEQIVIFSTFTSILKKISKLIKSSKLLIGEIDHFERDNIVTAFQNQEFQVLLSNIQVGGTGWTLSKASTAIFLNRSWNLSDNEQAEQRIRNVNSSDEVKKKTIIDLIAARTYEEKIVIMLKNKKKMIDVIKEFIKDTY